MNRQHGGFRSEIKEFTFYRIVRDWLAGSVQPAEPMKSFLIIKCLVIYMLHFTKLCWRIELRVFWDGFIVPVPCRVDR
jgi:hypothetical protein